MEELLEILPILNVAASKHDFPVYAQYIHSEGGKVRTCDGSAFIQMDCELPFEGDTNIFVLSDILKRVKNPTVSTDEDNIYIESGSFKTKLKITDVNFPQIEEPNSEDIEITEPILNKLKLATKFLGSDIYSYVFIGEGVIVSSDKERVFMSSSETADKPIGVDKRIVSLLDGGHLLGVAENRSTVVKFPEGYGIFVVDPIERYPVGKIKPFVNKTKDTAFELFNVAVVNDALEKLSPIFFGDKQPVLNIKNEDGVTVFTAESIINGKSTVEYETKVGTYVEIDINPNLFRDIPISFDVYYNNNYDDRLYLTDGESDIILLGE